MRRLLVLLAFVLVTGLGTTAFAQTYQYSPAPYASPPQYQQPYYPPQIGQAPMAGPSFDRERRERRGGVRVLSAWYGIEERACDATEVARRVCEGRSSCTIPASNRLCGDPVPNVVKVLTVWYRCEGQRPRSTTRWEGRYVGLRCD